MVKPLPDDIKTWVHKPQYRENPANITVFVGVMGRRGTWEFQWDHEDQLGAHHSAALRVARELGFADVTEVGINHRGMGFLFRPLSKTPEKKPSNTQQKEEQDVHD